MMLLAIVIALIVLAAVFSVPPITTMVALIGLTGLMLWGIANGNDRGRHG